MIRIKSISYNNKKKYLKQTKGYTKGNLFKAALQTFIRASFNKYISRRHTLRDYRSNYIKCFNACLKQKDFRFSLCMKYLKIRNISLNVKCLVGLFYYL